MSVTNIERVKIKRNTPGEYPELTAIDTTDGALIDFDGCDDKTLMIFASSSEGAKVRVHSGNGIQGVEAAEFEFDIPNGEMRTLVIESGKYKDVKVNKGKVKVTVTGTVSVGVIELP